MNEILEEDCLYIEGRLTELEKSRFQGSTLLITGCAGFLGFNFLQFFAKAAKKLNIQKIIGLDLFLFEVPVWMGELQKSYPNLFSFEKFDIAKDSLATIALAERADFVIHAASIASPVFYRKYPITTLDANVFGLRNLLEFYKEKPLKGQLFFSSSEIYGDPDPLNIPTDEEYRGNVSCIGPRACYDESKRLGETLCYLFAKEFQLPVTIVRPFNNYGPGMRLDDKRVPADFLKCILENIDIQILSSGSPTRTFCYVSDAIVGYLKCLVYGQFDYFNIGIETPEISVYDLAKIYESIGRNVGQYAGKIVYHHSEDTHYLTHNPQRRCPSIEKARKILNYNPTIDVYEGVERLIKFHLTNQTSKVSL